MTLFIFNSHFSGSLGGFVIFSVRLPLERKNLIPKQSNVIAIQQTNGKMKLARVKFL